MDSGVIIITIITINIDAIPMVTMAPSAANWRNTHTQSNGSHTFTHILYINTVTTTWCEATAQLLFFNTCWVFP